MVLDHIWIVMAILAVLSLTQRLAPWLIFRKHSFGKDYDRIFDYFAIAAFTTLMVDNIPQINVEYIVALVVALVVSIKTKNVGYAVISAMIVTLLASYFFH